MYALHTHREHVRRWHVAETLAWRARWALLALAAVALLAFGYAREAATSPLLNGGVRAASDTVTVEAGDTLWDLAIARYPDADTRQKVFEIEELNGLRGPTIVVGQRLRMPAG
jgi:nucleoid-associated protein YgaU